MLAPVLWQLPPHQLADGPSGASPRRRPRISLLMVRWVRHPVVGALPRISLLMVRWVRFVVGLRCLTHLGHGFPPLRRALPFPAPQVGLAPSLASVRTPPVANSLLAFRFFRASPSGPSLAAGV